MISSIDVPIEKITEFCRRNHIRRLSIFGSALRSDFSSDSDLDVLVEFEPGVRLGLRFFRLELELSEIMGRTVDLNTIGFLSRHFRNKVLSEAKVIYDTA